MFVVTIHGRPDYYEVIMSIEGIVYNEQDFDRYLDEKFPTLREKSKRIEGEHGKLSIHYEMVYPPLTHGDITQIVMQKIDEIGQPK